jgi:hypothetical protein
MVQLGMTPLEAVRSATIEGAAPVGPPVIGRFENGTGTFYSDDLVDGKPIRTRYIWGHITARSARWEQATSSDSGKSWETNWIMEFQRAQ